MRDMKAEKETFRKVLLDLLQKGIEQIDAEAFWKICRKENKDFKWLDFCEFLYTSHCFVVDDGTHGHVTLPKLLLEWNKGFMVEIKR